MKIFACGANWALQARKIENFGQKIKTDIFFEFRGMMIGLGV